MHPTELASEKPTVVDAYSEVKTVSRLVGPISYRSILTNSFDSSAVVSICDINNGDTENSSENKKDDINNLTENIKSIVTVIDTDPCEVSENVENEFNENENLVGVSQHPSDISGILSLNLKRELSDLAISDVQSEEEKVVIQPKKVSYASAILSGNNGMQGKDLSAADDDGLGW